MPENLVKQLRLARDWTQADVANMVGETGRSVTRQTIAAIENNDWCPSLDLAYAIARAFGMSIEAVFYPENPAPDPVPVADTAGASHA